MWSAPSRRPGYLARELVVLAARVRGVVLLALERVDCVEIKISSSKTCFVFIESNESNESKEPMESKTWNESNESNAINEPSESNQSNESNESNE